MLTVRGWIREIFCQLLPSGTERDRSVSSAGGLFRPIFYAIKGKIFCDCVSIIITKVLAVYVCVCYPVPEQLPRKGIRFEVRKVTAKEGRNFSSEKLKNKHTTARWSALSSSRVTHIQGE